jgi:hypothetical protein
MSLPFRPPGPRLFALRDYIAAQQYTVAVQSGKFTACRNFGQSAATAILSVGTRD